MNRTPFLQNNIHFKIITSFVIFVFKSKHYAHCILTTLKHTKLDESTLQNYTFIFKDVVCINASIIAGCNDSATIKRTFYKTTLR